MINKIDEMMIIFFIIMLALFSFRLFPLESFLHFKGKIMVIIIIPAVVFLDTVVGVYALLAAFILGEFGVFMMRD